MQIGIIHSSVFLFVTVLLSASGLFPAQKHSSLEHKVAPSDKAVPSKKELGDHYLMLVNTAVASYLTDDNFRQFDQSPYDGIAVAFLHAYDTSTPPTAAAIDEQIARWQKFTSKDIWPWVYVNRLIGMSVAENNPHSDNKYFRQIAGADLDDKKGALSEFLQIWRNSLTAARDSHVPGIACDLEFYNYYKAYDIGELARQTGKTPSDAIDGLKRLGARMADSAAEAYPNATLWMFASGLTHSSFKNYDGISYYPSFTYIAIGLLEEIFSKKLPLKVVTGGEASIGYCHVSLDEFKSSVQKRQSDLAGQLQTYKGILELGGTLALWSDRSARKSFMNEGACGTSDADSIEGLQPYIELLLRTYRYNWLYATSEGNYLPFSPASAPRFDRVIRKAEAQVGINSQKRQ